MGVGILDFCTSLKQIRDEQKSKSGVGGEVWLSRWIVAPEVVGSNPTRGPENKAKTRFHRSDLRCFAGVICAFPVNG